jgi:endonuclease G
MKLLFSLLLLLASLSANANTIDDQCGQLVYKSAPVVNADLYICHKEYAVAYSYKSKNPIYTTEHLISSHIGNIARTNDFRVDPAVPVEYQDSPKNYYHSGTACNGGRCDQGHMTPDQDFSADEQATHESFFMTNMVPQNFKNNEVIWRMMEMMIRQYVLLHDHGVYVITGPVYKTAQPATLGAGKVWIPDYLFKVVIDADTGKSIAFYMPNAPESYLPQFVTNLATIEAATGIKFDDSLNKNTVANFADWGKVPKKKP